MLVLLKKKKCILNGTYCSRRNMILNMEQNKMENSAEKAAYPISSNSLV